HLTETCDPDEPILITEVETTDATVPDSELTDRVQQRLVDSDLARGRQYADAGYVDAALLVASGRRGIDLYGPVRHDPSTHGGLALRAAAASLPCTAHGASPAPTSSGRPHPRRRRRLAPGHAAGRHAPSPFRPTPRPGGLT